AYEAEVERVEGLLRLRQTVPDAAVAEACFRRAIAISREQHAKWWELRATLCLARLLAGNGRTDEARSLLGEIRGRFTEGLETADMREAIILLEKLCAGAA